MLETSSEYFGQVLRFEQAQANCLVTHSLIPHFKSAHHDVAGFGIRDNDAVPFSSRFMVQITERRFDGIPTLLRFLSHTFDCFAGDVESRILAHRSHDVVDENIRGVGIAIEDSSLFVEVHFNLSLLIEFLDDFLVPMVAAQAIGFFNHEREGFFIGIVVDKPQNLVELFSLRLFARRFLKRELLQDIEALAPGVFCPVLLLGIQREAFFLLSIGNSIDNYRIHTHF